MNVSYFSATVYSNLRHAEQPAGRPDHEPGRKEWRHRHHRRQEALQRRRPQISPDGLLGPRLRAQGDRHDLPVPHHAAGRRGPDRGGRGGGRRVQHRHLDRGLDRPPDRLRQLPRQGLQGRAGAGHPGPVLRLGRLRPHPVRGRLDRQHHRQPHRQRVQLQAAAGLPAGGHARAGGAGQDLQGSADRPDRRARASRQVRPPAARCHHQAQAGPVRAQLRSRHLRGPEGRPGLHEGRREHQLAALHALARPLSIRDGRGQQGQRGHRRGQGQLPERHRRDHGRHLRARRVRQGARLGDHHDRPDHRLERDPEHQPTGRARTT